MGGEREKRMAGSYEITQAVRIGSKEVVFGVDETKEMPYFCGFYTSNALFGAYEDCMVCDDYVEAVELFAESIRGQCAKIRSEREEVTVPGGKITAEMCLPLKGDSELREKVAAVRLESLRPEYRSLEHQLVYVYGGNGTRGGARGSACFCVTLYDGSRTRWERYDLQGEVRPECLPQWAKEKAAEIARQRTEEKNKNTIERKEIR